MSEPKFAWQPIEKTDPVAARNGNSVAISKFISELRSAGLSESTLTSYQSNLNCIISGFDVPIMSITNSLLNARVANCYRENNWSDAYVKKIVAVLHKFFTWAKNHMYTGLTINVVNPVTGKSSFHHSDPKPRNTQVLEASQAVKHSKPEPVKDLLKSESPTVRTSEGSDSSVDKIFSLKSAAIMAVLRGTNLKPEEVPTLDIYDFIHNRLIFQGHGNRNFMRTVPIDRNVRNRIYDYLSSRNDSCDALFLSEEHPGERITEHEVRRFI